MITWTEVAVQVEDPEEHDEGVCEEEQDQVTPVEGGEHG